MTLLSDPHDASGRAPDDDAGLLAAVRTGDTEAYAVLYERHADAVGRLARRLCRDGYEADDVVSDVFANTLRAIQHGAGPVDDFRAYALRAVRNTVAKLRTRSDSARATPSEDDVLDRPDTGEALRLAGDVEHAFTELPSRFQEVLWTTVVEGHTPAEVAEAGSDGTRGLDPGAVATLSQRARKALGRSYLRVRTNRPARGPECHRVRNSLPGYVQLTASASTAARIETHLACCADCTDVRDEMVELNGRLRTIPVLALLAVAIRRVAIGVVGVGAPAAVTAAAPVVAIAVAGGVLVQHHRDDAVPDAATAAAAALATSADVPPPPEPGSPVPGAVPAAGGAPATDPPSDLPAATVVGPPDAAITPPVTTPTDAPGPPPDPPADGPVGFPPGVAIDGPDTGRPSGVVVTLPPLAQPPNAIPSDTAGVAGALIGGIAAEVVAPAGSGAGTLVDDVHATLTNVTHGVGALPAGVPAVVAATGELLNGVTTTVGNTSTTAGTVIGGATTTVGTTVNTLAATVDQAVAGAHGNVAAIAAVDPADPVGDLLGDVAGNGGLIGPRGTVDNLLGGLGLPGSPTAPGCTFLCGLG